MSKLDEVLSALRLHKVASAKVVTRDEAGDPLEVTVQFEMEMPELPGGDIPELGGWKHVTSAGPPQHLDMPMGEDQ